MSPELAFRTWRDVRLESAIRNKDGVIGRPSLWIAEDCWVLRSKAVGAVFGLTMRVMLYEAAQSMLRSKKWSWLKAWAMQIARRRGMKKAIVALARRLAVILHRIWLTVPSSAGPGKPQQHEGHIRSMR
jgi:hypothetical protein